MKLSIIEQQVKSHIGLNGHKMKDYFEEVITYLQRPIDASHFGMKFISMCSRTANLMREIMYNRAVFILHENVIPSHFHDVIKNRNI